MYNYIFDPETRGYLLTGQNQGVVKEVRPVYYEELDLLGFNKYWKYPRSEAPLMWAEGRRYIYEGDKAAEARGGGLFTAPELIIHKRDLELKPVDIKTMIKKNRSLMTGLVQHTLKTIYDVYQKYSSKVDVVYTAFSGGKDSLVLLDLVHRALPSNGFKVVFGDTSMEISDTYKAVEEAKKRWSNLEFYTAKSHLDATESWKLFGPPSRIKRWCCSVHKTAPSLLKLREIVGKDHIKALVYDGVRAEESDARSSYSLVSEGKKHNTQINCSPILNWGTSEVFLYIFENDLLLNRSYRYGFIRVGCAICPMSSQWWEFIANRMYHKDISRFIDIIKDNANNKFSDKDELIKYLDTGGWKGRMGGRDLNVGGNKIVEQFKSNTTTLIISDFNSDWKQWIKAIGNLTHNNENKYSIEYKGFIYDFEVIDHNNKLSVVFKSNMRTVSSIRFLYLLKNVFCKTAYCVYCKACCVECPTGALKIVSAGIQIESNCIHCESCLDMRKGCLAANSLMVTSGGSRMDIKGINRYQHFGFRKEWLSYFFKEKDNFWSCGKLGKYQFDGFRVWLKEAELTDNNHFNSISAVLEKFGADDIKTWAVIINNIVYNSVLFKWYIKNVGMNISYETSLINDMMGDSLSKSTRKNAITSLNETFKHSPIGSELGLGVCEMKGNTVLSITRTGWENPDPLVILYSLYKFAEKNQGHYAFTLSYLCDHDIEREGISPTEIFGIPPSTMKKKLMFLASNYPEYIKTDFNKDLDNIELSKEKRALDILDLF